MCYIIKEKILQTTQGVSRMEINMIKKITTFACCLLLCTLLFLFVSEYLHKPDSSALETPSETTTAKTKSTKDAFSELKPFLSDNKKVTYDFLMWIKENLNDNIFDDFESHFCMSHNSNDFWYDYTGMSFNVLYDFYKGVIDKDTATFSNGKEEISLGFAGDLCLSEGFDTCNFLEEHNNDLSQGIANGLINVTNNFDIFMLNNEFTYSNRGEALEGKYYTFRAKPERIEIIKELGTDIVSLSNNHVYDFGPDAFFDTLDTLKKADIPYVGAGADIEEAKKPQFFYINGIKIGFVAANRSEKYIFTPEATKDSPGVLRTYDSAEYLKVIKKAKKECDYLVAYVHWGTEDSNVVADYQKEMGREYIDAGADAIVGGHPHTLQGVEYYKGHPIAYSLGDFWFNNLTDETGVLDITIDSSGFKRMSFVPCFRTGGVTSLVKDKKERRRILDYLLSISFGVDIKDDGEIVVQ